MKKPLILFLILFLQLNIPCRLFGTSSIRVGIYNNHPLIFSDVQGRGKGIFADILEYVAAKEGWELNYVAGTFQECLSRLETHEIDILCAIAFSTDRDMVYDFTTEDLITNWGQLYTARDSGINAITDLKGKKLAVLKGDIHSHAFFQMIKGFGIQCEIIETESYPSILELISTHEVDAGVVNRLVGLKYKDTYFVESVKKTNIIFNPIKIHFAVSQGKNQDLISLLDKHIKSLKGTKGSVYYKSLEGLFGSASPSRVFPSWVKYALMAGLVLVVVLFFGNLVLRARVRAKTRELTRELNQRKQAETALRASHERFLMVLNSIDATIYVASMETHEILFMNQYMIQSFGRDYTGEICWQAFRGESSPCPHCTNDQLLDPEGKPTGLCIWQDINPITGKWYNNYDRAIEWTDGRLVKLQIATDITYLKQMEEKLGQVHKMESIGTLAGGVAHDFNNILSGILGYAQLADMQKDEPGKVKKYVGEIVKAAQRAAGLVQQILTFSRESEYKQQPLEVSILLKEALKLLRSTLPSTLEIQENIFSRARIMADPTQIHQVVMNLCTNAYHAMGDMPGVLTVGLNQIEFSDTTPVAGLHMPQGNYLKLEISDTGHGMDEKTMARIFDPYFTTKGVGKGSGLGLAVVYGIVKSHKGFIKTDSKVGRGSSFQLFFPIIEQADSPSIPKKELRPFSQGSEQIMLVDDEQDILKTLQAILERQGYKITAFEDSMSALQTFTEDPDFFDLIITDMTMPHMTGEQFSAQVLEIRQNMPIILCTGFHERFTEELARTLGIRKYLQKPVTGRELSGVIRDILDENIIEI